MDKFTVEEINLMCVFEGQDRTGMIADIKNVIPHIQDSDMVELAGQVLGKLEAMSDVEFAEVALGYCSHGVVHLLHGIGSGGVINANLL